MNSQVRCEGVIQDQEPQAHPHGRPVSLYVEDFFTHPDKLQEFKCVFRVCFRANVCHFMFNFSCNEDDEAKNRHLPSLAFRFRASRGGIQVDVRSSLGAVRESGTIINDMRKLREEKACKMKNTAAAAAAVGAAAAESVFWVTGPRARPLMQEHNRQVASRAYFRASGSHAVRVSVLQKMTFTSLKSQEPFQVFYFSLFFLSSFSGLTVRDRLDERYGR